MRKNQSSIDGEERATIWRRHPSILMMRDGIFGPFEVLMIPPSGVQKQSALHYILRRLVESRLH